ncbi:MAG: hypothetical protein GY945_05365 [Rhodobacteraceae bacterium]|nr:hypothetical protein [Paracoccaceae bacterium]
MIAPILRLLVIYLAVGLAVFGFFKRDTLMAMFAGEDAAQEHEAAPVTSQPPTETADEGHVTPVYAPLPQEGDATAQHTDPLAPTAPGDDSQYEDGLNDARTAYWQGKTQAAIASYRTLLAQYPEDESLNGELGNIYFMNDQRSEAAVLFEKAGMAALKAGHADTARMLVGVLRNLDMAAATRLINAGAGQ